MATDIPWLPGTLKPKEILAVTHTGEKCPGLGGPQLWGGFQGRQTGAYYVKVIHTNTMKKP